jgi:hypothetical protein
MNQWAVWSASESFSADTVWVINCADTSGVGVGVGVGMGADVEGAGQEDACGSGGRNGARPVGRGACDACDVVATGGGNDG